MYSAYCWQEAAESVRGTRIKRKYSNSVMQERKNAVYVRQLNYNNKVIEMSVNWIIRRTV